MNKTKIPWADMTWNPITGCTKGCSYCYARRIADRFGTGLVATKTDLTRKIVGAEYATASPVAKGFPAGFYPTVYPKRLVEPLRLESPARIFLGSMGDLFDPAFPDEFRDRVFATVAAARWHTFLMLTKQPENMRRYFTINARRDGVPVFGQVQLRNLWLGVTVTNQADADERIPLLLDTPAAHRFVSVEPMLGPVDLRHIAGPLGAFTHSYDVLSGRHYHHDDGDQWTTDGIGTLDFVTVGGKTPGLPLHEEGSGWWRESEKRFESCRDALRSLRDQCLEAGVPFMYKHGGTIPELDGVRHDAMPGGAA